MKMILLSVFLSALSFSDHKWPAKGGSDPIEMVIKNVKTLKKNSKDIAVEFFVINRNPFPVYLNNPSCWGASRPLIKYNGGKVPPALKVKVNPACAKELVHVGANDTLQVKYNYNIERFIDLSKTGNYKLQFEYNGALFNEKKNKLNDITFASNEISFDVQE
jgi:hypothetical protein